MKRFTLALLMLVFGVSFMSSFTIAQVAPPQSPRQSNGLALTPPMGWNSWNKFACNINESVIHAAADALVSSGMKDAGYQYVVIDDCWHGERDSNGDIQADPKRFPSGIKALADYIHGKGLKFGIYSDAGKKTCADRPGSRGFEYQDARQYAAWGVDYLKYDWCSTGSQDAKSSYETMSDALRASGRPIVFSICEWGKNQPWLWGETIGNLWRMSGDIYDGWESRDGHYNGMTNILDMQVGLESYAGPGHWNDPDMLEVGNGGMTFEEYKSHFSLWAVLAAPLIAGNDLAHMSKETQSILLNKEVIAVDQDALGIQASRLAKNGDDEVWVKPLKGGGRAIVLFNRSKQTHKIGVSWEALGYPATLELRVRDLWSHKDLPKTQGSFAADVQPHGVVMIRVET
ncbi:glycoside hydrolase family 27 protein [Rhodanobacter sp. C03]|uniref:glycoside hydrolase family 27 protein n=1 Tax=Rhodanobacter sp. C03 TaxID=1945858 RepID=UPI0009853DC0|nr:glycoside hydrolase family 27 protein [Rhodanobacter sp. C03]OOG59698.1 alpha-galactosidase [Rhodanobacter sp. C03]